MENLNLCLTKLCDPVTSSSLLRLYLLWVSNTGIHLYFCAVDVEICDYGASDTCRAGSEVFRG